MATLTVPFGYGNKRVDIDQLDNFETWAKLHPEFKRRVVAMFQAAEGHLGVGTGWRSTDVQKTVFLQRHKVSPSGNIHWDGKTWALLDGMAPAAPPGLSFHEGINNGQAMAIDVVGDTKWADAHADQFGLVQFEQVNHEPWHFQCAELPHGVSAWLKAGRPQPKGSTGTASPVIVTPAKPVSPPASTGSGAHPTLHLGDTGAEVAAMQALLIRAGIIADTPGNHDGRFGPATARALEKFQSAHALQTDGRCGPQTWNALSS